MRRAASRLALAAALLLPLAAHAERRQRPDPKEVYSVPVSGSPYRGPTHAEVTLVMVGEFACPYCVRAKPTIDELEEEYQGDLKIVFKHRVVHEMARAASQAACAAHEQSRFWDMEEVLWEKAYQRRDFSRQNLEGIARELQLDLAQFRRDIDGRCAREVKEDDELMQRLGVGGVPAFFINGRYLAGAQPIGTFRKLIDEELEKAKKRLDRGAELESYYRDWVVEKGERETAPARPRPTPSPGPRVPGRPDPEEVYSVPIKGDPYRGPRYAKVTLVLGCQFFGPFCHRVQPTIAALRDKYGKDLKVVYKHLRVHKAKVTPAHLAACAAHRQGKYFDFADLLWGETYRARETSEEAMRKLARKAGLAMKKFSADYRGRCEARVKADEEILHRVGARGTPSSFINGRFLSGAQPTASFERLIDEELEKASRRIQNRRQLRRYYRRYVVKQGKKEVER